MTKAGIYYVESVVRFQKSSRSNEAIIRQVADMDKQEIPIRKEQEPGSSGKDTIDNYRRRILPEFNFEGISSSGSKSSRAGAFASQAEAGNVKIVAGHWNKDYLDELEVFPDGPHDDQVDGSSGAFNYLAGIGVTEFRMRFV
jgi:predicted phage terminase large subunit-like protein